MNTTTTSNTGIEGRYMAALAAIPAPGTGCHAALLGVANLGIMAGLDDGQLLSDILASIPPGGRKVTAREINDAIKRAHVDVVPRGDASTWTAAPRRRRAQIGEQLKDPDAAAKLQSRVLAAGGGDLHPDDVDVWERSPYKLHHSFEDDAALLLETLYQPDDLLFIGAKFSAGRENIRTAGTWAAFFRGVASRIRQHPADRQAELFAQLGDLYPHIIPNPISGQPAPANTGERMTLRGDGCVKSFRYIVAEFDNLPMEKQGGVLRGLCRQYGFRVAALIFSGSKSCHAWIIADGIETRDAWRETVQGKLFPVLAGLGVDRACSNPARLSRMPGMFRRDKGNWQRLFWLAPEGGAL